MWCLRINLEENDKSVDTSLMFYRERKNALIAYREKLIELCLMYIDIDDNEDLEEFTNEELVDYLVGNDIYESIDFELRVIKLRD